ncbi:hypothetical protein ACJX0J_034699, partial [Zea mays]
SFISFVTIHVQSIILENAIIDRSDYKEGGEQKMHLSTIVPGILGKITLY